MSSKKKIAFVIMITSTRHAYGKHFASAESAAEFLVMMRAKGSWTSPREIAQVVIS